MMWRAFSTGPYHEDRFIPKMLANKLVVLSTGEWVLPFWRENAVLGRGLHSSTFKLNLSRF